MPVRARLNEPPPLPIPTMLAAIDAEGRRSAERARDLGVPAFRAVEPAVSGRLRKGTRGRVTRTAAGFALTIGPSGRERYPSGVTDAQVFRFADRGTGVFGPKGRPIRPRHGMLFTLPGGWFATELQGQRAQGILERGRAAADPLVTRTLEEGATLAARRAEQVMG